MTHVLVIDDNVDLRDMLRLVLQDGGYTVVDDVDGATLVDYLHTTPRGLVVLLDYYVPHLDTEALLAQVLTDPVLARRHAFICVTASSRERLPPTFVALLSRLNVPLLTKPFDLDDLLVTIKQVEHRLH
jgi:CheY-like chemotaxis protein